MNDSGRRQHYGEFYAPAPPRAQDGLPLVAVIGNCQAESVRVLLEGTGRVRTVRVPPVFEWAPEDIDAVGRLLARTDGLIAQPIRDDYRGLPSGTRQLEALLPPSSSSVRVPVLRYAGLHPHQVIVRDPQDSSLDPPEVPYHDLRTIAEALARPDDDEPRWPRTPAPALEAPVLEALHAESVEQLRAREQAHGAVAMSDVLERRPHWHTINHPDNATLSELARRVLAALGLPEIEIPDPGRELLRSIEAPVDPEHARALRAELRPDARHEDWRVGWGPEAQTVGLERIARAQLAFCRARPQLLERAVQRHGERMRLLGLGA